MNYRYVHLGHSLQRGRIHSGVKDKKGFEYSVGILRENTIQKE